MREFQERRRMKKLMHSRYVIAGLAVVVLILIHAVWGAYSKYEKSKELMAHTATDETALQTRNQALQQSINELNTPEGQEKEIRDHFGDVKPGESVIVLVDDATSAASSTPQQPEGFWARFRAFLGL